MADPRAVERIVQAALDRPEGARTAYVTEACAGDEALRHAVEALLTQGESSFGGEALDAAARQEGPSTIDRASLTGTRVGPYEVGPLIGRGGMGEVYRARDTKLGRQVALKVLPEAFVTDRERRARFEREAKLLASLSHPNIAVVYGLEEAHGTEVLVLELIEGDTLADRMARGAMPVRDAIRVGLQLAEALEAAHGQGVIHRDLKPANVKVRPDGTVKVLDFGLAKAVAVEGAPARASQSPTMTSPTRHGVILGTAGYVSPEQARGESVDVRADIWAFGVVLFELLTGRQLFDGRTTTDVLAAVLTQPIPWDRLPDDLHPRVRSMLDRCLTREPRRRYHSIADARADIDEALETPSEDTGASPDGRTRSRVPLKVAAAAAAVTGLAVLGVVLWLVRGGTSNSDRVIRLPLANDALHQLAVESRGTRVAISPDGRRIAYIGENEALILRDLSALEPRVLVRNDNASAPFFSADGQWVGYFPANRPQRRVHVDGGPPEQFVSSSGGPAGGAAWADDGSIVLATQPSVNGLQLVAPGSLERRALTVPDRSGGEANHMWPSFLPGSRALLFTILPVDGGLERAQVALLDLETGRYRVVVNGGSNPRYVPTGHVVYSASGGLRAVPFDLEARRVSGPSVSLGIEVFVTEIGGADFAISDNGTLVYVPNDGTSVDRLQRDLVWVNRDGEEQATGAPPRLYWYPRISPDGRRVLLDVLGQERGIRIWDFRLRTLTPVALEHGSRFPAWMPDGRHFVFTGRHEGRSANFRQSADSTGEPELLGQFCESQQTANAVTPDGASLIVDCDGDLYLLALDGSGAVTPLLRTPNLYEYRSALSPDGRWLAYHAGEPTPALHREVYVRPFPDVQAGQYQVSTTGGVQPWWSPTGDELFYFSPDGALMGVSVAEGDTWSASPPVQVIARGYAFMETGAAASTIDVSPTDGRFLASRPARPANADSRPRLVVVQNWFAELERLVPIE